MRIASLTLQRYGYFEDRKLEFGPGLTVVTGPNEAGKSTLLDAVSDLLWGFPRPVRHAYGATASRLAISADVLIDGQEHRLHRTARALIGDSAESVEPAWGDGGAEARQTWRQSFGLDHATLRSGGRQLCAGEGDLAELVFTARSGQDVRSIIARISEEADGLYRLHRNSKSVEVRAAMARVDQINEQLGARLVRAGAVAALEETIRTLESAADGLQRDRTRARLELRLAVQRTGSFHHAVELAYVEAERGALGDLGVALDEGQLGRFDAATSRRDAATAQLSEQQDELDQLRGRREQLNVDHAVLADAATIADLAHAAQARAADAERAAALRTQAIGHRRSAEHLIGELTDVAERPVAAWLAALHVPADRVADLDAHSRRLQAAEQAAEDADAAQLVAVREVRDNLGDGTAFDAAVVRAVGEARQAIEAPDSAVALRHRAIEQRADAIVQVRHARAASGCLLTDDDGPLPDPPSAERVAALRDSLRAASADVSGAERDQVRAEERARRSAEALRVFTGGGPSIGPDELARARTERDKQLDHLLAVLAAGGKPHAVVTAAVTLERAVRDADHVADHMIAAGNRAAEERRLRTDVDAAETELRAATRNTRDAMRRRSFAAAQWSALWGALAVREPGPDAAETVFTALEHLHRAESERQHAHSRIDGLATAALNQESALRAALAAAGLDRSGADVSALLVAAAELETRAGAARDQQVRVAEIRERARRVAAEADARRHDLQEAVGRWRFSLRAAGLLADMTPVAWSIREDRVAKAREAHGEAEGLDAEARTLQRRFDEHHAAVNQVLGRHGIGGGDSDAGLAELSARVGTARAAAISADHLDEQIQRTAAALQAGQDTVAAAETELDGLVVEIAVDGRSDLAVATERGRRRAALDVEASRLAALITSGAPDLPVADWVAETVGHDEADLIAQKTEAENASSRLDEQYAGIREQLGGARGRLVELESAEPAAALHAEAQEHLARVAEAAERYVVLNLQREILREELDAYERRHSSPLLAEAGSLLEQLTDGRYVALRPAVAAGPAGPRSLVVVRADEEELTTDQLSEGTADQLFLALRLAGIAQLQRDRAGRGLPLLPVVLDDLLMTFDDDRAAAAISVLADLAADWQILLLTHHDHLAELPLRPDTRSVTVVALDPASALERVRDADSIRAEPTPWPIQRAVGSRPTDDGPDPSDVRAWARANGHDVGERGRISAEVRSAYLQRV